MKNLKLVAFVFLFFVSCKEQKKSGSTEVTIATGKMPALAKDASNNLHLAYGYGDSIMYTYSDDKGSTFSIPVLIDTLKGLVASATRGPQITVTKNGVSVIAVNNDGNIFSFTKDKAGKWTRTAKVNDEDEVDKEGFTGLSSDGNNNLFAIWTDLRGDKHNKIYGARSTDGGITWNKNILVYASPDSTVCECCKPSVAMRGSNVYVMFRNWLNGNRDLYLIQSSNGGNSFGKAEKLGTGNWKLNGCPMDGGGLAIASNAVPQTVWRRESKIFAATSGQPEKEIGEGKSCSIESINGKNIYAWVDNNSNIVCLLPNGAKTIIGKGILPIVKSVNDKEVVCVWQQEENIKSALINL